ncbi:MAG: hypothetical protein EAY75_11755 [Bacteroidetes bacterium]|nr:MAG: hypothetical protein EAY75_11755 [Bacteroidota bacterium]
MKKVTMSLLLVAVMTTTFFVRCGSGASVLGAASPLISALTGAGNLGTIAKVLQTPGLGKLLGGALNKPFTLLAPNDGAFNALGAGALSNLTKPENIGNLANILRKHVVPGKLDAGSVLKGGLSSLGGGALNLGGAKLGNLIGGDKFNIIPVDRILP